MEAKIASLSRDEVIRMSPCLLGLKGIVRPLRFPVMMRNMSRYRRDRGGPKKRLVALTLTPPSPPPSRDCRLPAEAPVFVEVMRTVSGAERPGTARTSGVPQADFQIPKARPQMAAERSRLGNAEIDARIGEADDPRQNELHFHLRRNTPTYLPCGCLFSSVDSSIVPGRLEGSHGSGAFEEIVP